MPKDKYPGEIRYPPPGAPRRPTIAERVAKYQKPDPGPPKSEYQQRCELRLTTLLFKSRIPKLTRARRRQLLREASRRQKPRRRISRPTKRPKRRAPRRPYRYTHPTMRRRTLFVRDEHHAMLKAYGAGNFSQGLYRICEEFRDEIKRRAGEITKESEEKRTEKVIEDLAR